MSKIKTKIVEYVASEVNFKLQEALNEVTNLRQQPQFLNRLEGIGLDLAVLNEKLESAMKLNDLLR